MERYWGFAKNVEYCGGLGLYRDMRGLRAL